MDLKRPTRATAIERTLRYIRQRGWSPPSSPRAAGNNNNNRRRRNVQLAALRAACDAMQFSTEACRIPLHIPLRHTVPHGGVQYVLGRVDTLDINGYNNLDSVCMRVLNLGYEPGRPGEVTWNIFVNDMFIACGASRAYAFGQFPVRLVVDPLVRSPPRAGNRVRRFHRIEQVRRVYDADNALARFGHYRNGGMPSVTVREMCQLLHVFGMRMYKYVGPDWDGQYDLYFFSPATRVPAAYRTSYVEAKVVA